MQPVAPTAQVFDAGAGTSSTNATAPLSEHRRVGLGCRANPVATQRPRPPAGALVVAGADVPVPLDARNEDGEPDDREALEMTRGAWEAAFHRRPFYRSTSLSLLADRTDEHYDRARMAV